MSAAMPRRRGSKYPPAPNEAYSALDDVLTTGEAARRYHYSRRAVTAWCEAGYVAARQIGGRWILSEISLKLFLEQRHKAMQTGAKWRVRQQKGGQ